jgi:hypothetical protein
MIPSMTGADFSQIGAHGRGKLALDNPTGGARMEVSPPIPVRIEWADSQGNVTASWLAAHFKFSPSVAGKTLADGALALLRVSRRRGKPRLYDAVEKPDRIFLVAEVLVGG